MSALITTPLSPPGQLRQNSCSVCYFSDHNEFAFLKHSNLLPLMYGRSNLVSIQITILLSKGDNPQLG